MRLSFGVPTIVAGVPSRSRCPARRARMRILLVDDDPLLLKSLRDTLRSMATS